MVRSVAVLPDRRELRDLSSVNPRSGDRQTWAALLLILATSVPSLYGPLAAISGHRGAYALGTALMLVIAGALPFVWPRSVELRSGPLRRAPAIVAALVGLVLLVTSAFRLLPHVFIGPIDSTRGDMLVIVEHAITLFLDGGHPYAVHHVPWDAPLSYGPPLWMPLIVPYLLRADFRIVTLAAQLVVPGCLFLAAAMRAGQYRIASAAVMLGAGAALAFNPEIARLYPIGHTQMYWPLILVFCGLLAARRWTAAAICLGLLVAARTTMVSLVPVFLLYLFGERALTLRRAAALALAALLPFLPFVIADPGTVWYAMFGVYMKLMKGFVWHSTRWAVDTYGITGRLLELGLERYVEATQIAALLLTYALAWRSMRRGTRPEPWMAIALLVFSMTTLWPVIYLYFDVWIFIACALVASTQFWSSAEAPAGSGVVRTTVLLSALSLVVVLSTAAWRPGSAYAIDVGSAAAAGFTGGGFGRDEAVVDEGRTVVWIEGETARIRLPRAGWTGAAIRVAIKPHAPQSGVDQRVAAALNGRPIGSARLQNGWQEVVFESRARDWFYGFNVLDLRFSYASPAADGRSLGAAIDWVRLE
jgi:hypothetical protein